MSVAVDVETKVERPASAPGVDPVDLTRRVIAHVRRGALSPATLERWLVDNRFAVRRDGLLFPTELGLELGRRSSGLTPTAMRH